MPTNSGGGDIEPRSTSMQRSPIKKGGERKESHARGMIKTVVANLSKKALIIYLPMSPTK